MFIFINIFYLYYYHHYCNWYFHQCCCYYYSYTYSIMIITNIVIAIGCYISIYVYLNLLYILNFFLVSIICWCWKPDDHFLWTLFGNEKTSCWLFRAYGLAIPSIIDIIQWIIPLFYVRLVICYCFLRKLCLFIMTKDRNCRSTFV